MLAKLLGAIGLVLLTLSAPTRAQDAAVDFSAPLTDIDGHAMKDDFQCVGRPDYSICLETQPDLTLGAASIHALLLYNAGESNVSDEEKWRRGVLAVAIKDGRTADLTVDQIDLIKKKISARYGPMVVFRALSLLGAPKGK